MSSIALDIPSQSATRHLRVRGIVQGVGFRPTVWRHATELGLAGDVRNDGDGVLIRLLANTQDCADFIDRLQQSPPPLARIDKIESVNATEEDTAPVPTDSFEIAVSEHNQAHTAVSPDAATCQQCMADATDPFGRRYRYGLTNCTHCGPRFSIVKTIPYDRVNTSMDAFSLCPQCDQEYRNPADRRFHAQPNACHDCGPTISLERFDGKSVCLETLSQLDAMDAACSLLQQGEIIAIKGVGGFHLACDATNSDAVQRLRERKQRYAKPFAIMARDMEVLRKYVVIDEQEEALLGSAEAPIVLLRAIAPPPAPLPLGEGPGVRGRLRQFGIPRGHRAADLAPIAEAVAPGQNTLGCLLPYTPMHQLMLKRMNRPIVLTSGNRSDEPQCTSNEQARERLGDIADFVLWHDRDIINRVDDSVVRIIADQPRLLRRARGYAPAPIPLPPGFENAPELLACGAELKNSFCLIKDDQAVLSQHMGDLENAATLADYEHNLALYHELYQHQPTAIVVDAHPEYLSSKLGREHAEHQKLPLIETHHHHAHIAACLGENDWPMDAGKVLGVALDGLGFGADGTLWGGEFLIADYHGFERVGTFKPVAMLGGAQAMREPWRNTYAQLIAAMSWAEIKMNYEQLELVQFLESQPLETFNAMLDKGMNAPLASSCGRLFDAVAAAIGLCREQAHYEGQAAIELEAIVDQDALHGENEALAYPFGIPKLPASGLSYVETKGLWQALLGDLILKTAPGVIAARFHRGLAKGIVTLIKRQTTRDEERFINTVALSGGVFQNRVLFEQVEQRLLSEGYQVLSHARVPANDGGLAFGQALIALAHLNPNREN